MKRKKLKTGADTYGLLAGILLLAVALIILSIFKEPSEVAGLSFVKENPGLFIAIGTIIQGIIINIVAIKRARSGNPFRCFKRNQESFGKMFGKQLVLEGLTFIGLSLFIGACALVDRTNSVEFWNAVQGNFGEMILEIVMILIPSALMFAGAYRILLKK